MSLTLEEALSSFLDMTSGHSAQSYKVSAPPPHVLVMEPNDIMPYSVDWPLLQKVRVRHHRSPGNVKSGVLLATNILFA